MKKVKQEIKQFIRLYRVQSFCAFILILSFIASYAFFSNVVFKSMDESEIAICEGIAKEICEQKTDIKKVEIPDEYNISVIESEGITIDITHEFHSGFIRVDLSEETYKFYDEKVVVVFSNILISTLIAFFILFIIGITGAGDKILEAIDKRKEKSLVEPKGTKTINKKKEEKEYKEKALKDIFSKKNFYQTRTEVVAIILVVICAISCLSSVIVAATNKLEFDNNCYKYIVSSAYAIDVETAKENLAIAIDYIEKNNLTSGTTAIFFKEHGYNFSIWYETLVKGYEKLEEVSKDATFKEETLVIEKMRESFIAVGLPDGIEDYPYNTELFVWALSSFFGIPIFMIVAVIIHIEKKRYR